MNGINRNSLGRNPFRRGRFEPMVGLAPGRFTVRAVIVSALLMLSPLVGQAPARSLNTGPFRAPEEMKEFVRRVTLAHLGMRPKVEALLRMTFAPVEDGGLGLQYDNGRTRSVQEVWQDRRANCLGLTAFFVASCRVMGLEAGFAEAPGVSQWRKIGDLIRNEKHMVAVLDNKPLGLLVMDFAPELRRSFYQVIPLGEDKALALFHSNRAVEALDSGLIDEAFTEAQAGIAASPAVGVAWNVLGVVQRERKDAVAAEAAFRKALAVDPWGGSACGNLESLCQSQGRDVEADAFRKLAVNLRAKDPYFHAFLAKEALGRNDFKLARKEINAALKIYKQEPEFYVLMAMVEIQSGDQRDAERALEEAKKWASPLERARMDSKLARIRNPGN